MDSHCLRWWIPIRSSIWWIWSSTWPIGSNILLPPQILLVLLNISSRLFIASSSWGCFSGLNALGLKKHPKTKIIGLLWSGPIIHLCQFWWIFWAYALYTYLFTRVQRLKTPRHCNNMNLKYYNILSIGSYDHSLYWFFQWSWLTTKLKIKNAKWKILTRL